jgi:enediyne biosynthesis protein E4
MTERPMTERQLRQELAQSMARVLVSAALSAVLVGCGGGGGGDGDDGGDTVGPPPPPAAPAPARQFSNITNSTGISFVHGNSNATHSKAELFAGGAASGDYDADGDIDLYVVRGNIGPNLLYRNDGGNRFTDVAAAAGVARTKPGGGGYRQSGPAFADLDGDGDLDLFIGGLEGDPCAVFENNGNGTFTDRTAQSVIGSMGATSTISAAFGDYDLDGDLDAMLAHWGTARPPDGSGGNGDTESLWRNDSDANGIRFTNVSVESGIAATIIARRGGYNDFQPNALDYDYTFVPTFARMDADRYPDILSVADFSNTRFYLNNGLQNGRVTFRDATDNTVIIDRNGMGSAVGDFDNDGDLDWFVTGIFGVSETVGNRLYRNNGGGNNGAGLLQDSGWGWGACFADFNLDGRLDIFHTNGWDSLNPIDNFQNDRSRLFISQANGRFTDEAGTRGMSDIEQGRAVVCADFDRDGDVDIFMTNRGLANSGAFWLNGGGDNANRALAIRLAGAAPNTEAVGARIRVSVGGTTQLREVAVGNNFTSQNPATQVFGLGAASAADSVQVEWPDGSTETFTNVAAGNVVFHQ